MSRSDGGGQMPSGGIQEILRVRRDKASRLVEAGWSSFPNGLTVEHHVEDVRSAQGDPPSEAQEADPWFTLGGRLMAVRGMGKQSFLDLWDHSGRLQLQVRRDIVGEDTYKKVKLLDIGDIVVVKGPRFVTRRGELTLQVRDITLATKSLYPLPDKHAGLTDIEQRYRQRYLDLATSPEVKEIFAKRSHIIRFIRRFLDERGFMEVETPVLHSLISGASAQPFTTHHNALDMDLYCRIAPELHLKRLLVGGFPRVYEIGRNFRNEGLSPRHNPEFTMLEFYQAFATYEDLMDLSEVLLRALALDVTGSLHVPHGGWEEGSEPVMLDFSKPFRRVAVR
ncbi:MAG: lysine--tRNA ligase, partial [Myxococcales bacterium]|nr:lysine--tRNA ligase [Myxococcales bacterium]